MKWPSFKPYAKSNIQHLVEYLRTRKINSVFIYAVKMQILGMPSQPCGGWLAGLGLQWEWVLAQATAEHEGP